MIPDERDTIVAPATAIGLGARGAVRMSGPQAMTVFAAISPTARPEICGSARCIESTIAIDLAGRQHQVPVEAYVWPGERSYARQPTIELHMPAAQPLIDAVVRACCAAGARLAQPGEFTLRAFLSGRIDLTQAEAVLGVIDASSNTALGDALARLAGGLSTPLHALRESLTQLLAELEAGLDFVDEEDIRFIEPEELAARLATARAEVRSAVEQTINRGTGTALPMVVLAGPPNAGKSRLFNALRERYGASDERRDSTGDTGPEALVSDQAGTTRDTLAATLAFDGVRFQLIDTAGVAATLRRGVDAVAIDHTQDAIRRAAIVLRCGQPSPGGAKHELAVATKCDLPAEADPPSASLPTSAVTGTGLEALMQQVVQHLADVTANAPRQQQTGVSARARESLVAAEVALERAAEIAPASADELVAEELRQALAALGDVVGATATDDLLDRIFGQFCIGK